MEERHHLTRSGLQILLGNVNGCNFNGCNYMINKALIIIHYMHFASSMPGNAYLKHATNFVSLARNHLQSFTEALAFSDGEHLSLRRRRLHPPPPPPPHQMLLLLHRRLNRQGQ